jgi:hypothetical protein
MINSQINYYQTTNGSPVIFSPNLLTRHTDQRKNLFENHLKIPLSWFRSKQVLEFGPNEGNNACILASTGAFFDFVEPGENYHAIIRNGCTCCSKNAE